MIIFDVGANNGNSCYHFSDDPDNEVYAFEPTPYLCQKYLYPREQFNYMVIPVAISDRDGECDFFLAEKADGGASSLYEFSDNLDKTWPGRQDLVVTNKITVETMRIDSFMELYGLTHVDYLHCDAQGNDLKVLESFGKYISKLQEGVVEAYMKNPVYKGIENSKESIVAFLESHGFKITGIAGNDYADPNEVNIHFKRC